MSSSIDSNSLQKIAQKVLNNTATKEEQEFLKAYYDQFEKEKNLSDQMSDLEKNQLNSDIKDLLDNSIKSRESHVLRFIRKPFPAVAASLALLMVLSVSAYYLVPGFSKPEIAIKEPGQDISAGGKKAVLVLGSGDQIDLEAGQIGELVSNTSYSVIKDAAGSMAFKSKSNPSNSRMQLNTLLTPKGGEYKLTLPDGTIAWLNAESSISFPTAFDDSERRVTIKGEVYFEVASDKRKPFRVVAYDQIVEVLGTHFNIHAYPDEENITTTLLEGSIRVREGNSSVKLSPGQQSIVSDKNPEIAVQNVDTEIALSWKNGYFYFENTSLQDMMQQITRWYDIEVVYEGKKGDDVFFGKIDRKAKLSTVLKILEVSKVKFRIEGRKLILM